MHFPQYWARGTAKAGRLATSATGWSDKSVVDACDVARARAERVLLALAAGKQLDHYAYGERDPLREEVVERHGRSGDSAEVVITRNRYGALVLNSAGVMFIDIDEPKKRKGGFLSFLFGGRKDLEAERMLLRRRVEDAVLSQKSLHCVLYRTAAGFRVLVLNRLFSPDSEETKALFDAVGTDPLYARLTQNQKCFRARLTPKPWRCGMAMPDYDFPRETERPELTFMRWLTDYNRTIAGYATCEFLTELGSGEALPAAAFVRRLHDSYCLAAGRPLA
jgi:hypothetical protein